MIFFNDQVKEEIDKFIAPPRKLIKKHYTSYVFYISRLFYFFEVTKNSGLEIFQSGNLKMNNTIEIPIIYNSTFKGFLRKFYGLQLR